MDLLADLDDLGQDLESESDNKTEAADDEEMVDVMQAMSDAHKALVQSVQGVDDVNTLVKVYKSPQFNQVVSKIDKFMEQVRPVRNGTVESDPEYPTIVAANSLAFEMDYEIIQVQKFISDHYEPRFPELESLIPTPKEYARAVKLIGNENDMTHLDLKSFLPAATVMVVSTVTATKKRPLLSDSELCRIMLACDIALEIYEGRANLIRYVESRMASLAPNITALVGSDIAAKLMGVSGGLVALSRIPACNILILGKTLKANTGMSRVYMGIHAGVIYQCSLVVECPDDLRRKAARILSAKVALAARIDNAREATNGEMGFEYRTEVQKKIDLLLQPAPSKRTKALPLPIEFKKRRGGKRARKQKERMAPSEMSKSRNRMAFGEAEIEVGFGDETIGLGLVGGSSGNVRSAKADTRRIGVSKKHKNHGGNNTAMIDKLGSVTIPSNPSETNTKAKADEKSKYFTSSM